MRSSFFFLLLLIFSCNSSQTKTPAKVEGWETQLDQVMQVHDKVMPFTSKIVNLNKRLKSFEDKHPNLSKDEKQRLEDVQNQLTKAEEGMWDWMHGFVQPNEKDDVQKARLYLENEHQKISAVSDAMTSSMNAAKKIITDLNIPE